MGITLSEARHAKNDPSDSLCQSAMLEHALSKLSDRQRTTRVLWSFTDVSIEGIAKQLMIDENAVHQLLHRASQSFRRELRAIA
jgi:DNA-directed RNA polymerase specialized sigma24 family protein